MTRPISLATSLVALLASSMAVAQVSPQSGSSAASGRTATAPTTIDLDTITVTAARAERSSAETPQSIQVIDRTEIEQQLKFSPNAAAALGKLVPGYSMSTQTVSSASENYRGRDLLVMIDGVPMNTPLRDVSRILSLIDLTTVERIELVAGASSLYGAGATGGTVNFITKKAAEGKPRVTVNTAIRGFTQNIGRSLAPEASVTVSGKVPDGIDYLFSGQIRGAGRTYDGAGRELPSDGLLGQGGGDRYKAGNLLAKLGYDFAGGKRIEFNASWIGFDQDPKYLTNYAAPFARPDRTQLYNGQSVLEDTKSVSLRYSDADFALGKLSVLGYYNDIKKRFNYSTFSYPYNSQVYYSFNPLSPTSRDNQTTLYSQRGGLNVTVDTPLDRILPGAKLTWGGDLIQEKTWQTLTNGQNVFTPLKQTTAAGFGQLQIPIGERVVLRGGLRYEHFSLSVSDYTRPAAYAAVAANNAQGYQAFVLPALRVVGGDFDYSAVTANLGATIKLSETSEIFGGFSQGFALPDVGAFTRRAGISTQYACPVQLPNCLPANRQTVSYSAIAPKAQIVNNYELGIRGSYDRFKGSLTGFISTSDDGVTFDSVTNTMSQQKERIWGVEATGDVTITDAFTMGTVLSYREGRYDTNGDGKLDSNLPNNRIGSPWRGMLYGSYRFVNGMQLRVEGEAFSDRDVAIDLRGTRYKLKGAATMNVALTAPVWEGEAYVAVNNLFDRAYQNPTATSVRNLPNYGWGRTMTVGFRKTF
ncbi:TonB-dependent receptor [uncultured Bosea sp.]|uniref:TonB-dependent receptor n=1 Tax=uncultured Bosea sp. TaxID=211457 RepID=UPI0025F4D2AA|nr:TonB-dependent receptor [uncultured Bosea sp.]